MSTSLSRSDLSPGSVPADEELRLPRPPGVIRRFWARHPLFTDILIALIFLALSTPGTIGGDPRPATAFLTPLAVLAGSALLLKRRRWPIVVFVAAWVAAASYLLQGTTVVGGSLVLIATYSLAVYRSVRACWIGSGIGLGGLSVLSFTLSASGAISFAVAINAVIGNLVLGLIGALIGINVGNRKRYLEAVIDRSRQLLVERDQHAQLAAAAERDRIAREMHDIVSHSLTVVVALSEGAAATPDRGRARAASTAAAATARDALTEMRSMLGVLRDGAADAPLAPLVAASPAETVAEAQRAGFDATLAVRGDAEVAPALRFAIGRIVQEGVTNAMRHAAHASLIDVRIDHDADPIVIEIVNDGVSGTGSGSAASGAASSGGFGLRGLVERATLLGGMVVSAPAGRGRWMLRAELPRAGAAPAPSAPEGATAGAAATAAGTDSLARIEEALR
ncbi:sensor histidine kinase [Microbacterium panaciterrae]|uniref:histidine kinase n=1 Tax=Microbacterium panaciterrae TaxID=985759 RepID=A0ABP8P4E5_9MICO